MLHNLLAKASKIKCVQSGKDAVADFQGLGGLLEGGTKLV